MKKLPAWAKALAAIALFAALYGAARFLIYPDHTANGKVGIE